MTEFKTIGDRVLAICLDNPSYVGFHNKIIQEYWNRYDPNLDTPVLSITRSYQKLCEVGKIPLTDAQKLERQRRTKKYVDHFVKGND